ncbi:hypothetical protein LIER_37837 [Lithospermum erythrorhizon]|uniref:Receptor ligand binding region domain-containing protein n=1 Tax=Lithospermum erythrorhizon TaxID=34254 RepID=A0AAV3PSI4_LITER
MLHPKLVPAAFLGIVAVLATIFAQGNNEICSPHNHHNENIGSIVVVVDEDSLVGREQKLAMEIAVQDFNMASPYFKLKMMSHSLKHPYERSPIGAAEAAIDLIRQHKSVQAIVGQFSLQEAVIISEFIKLPNDNLPLIILNAVEIPSKSPPLNIFQMNNNNTLTMQMQCLSDIISHFKWPKVTALYEQTNSFSSMDLGIITQFSDSLKDSSNSIIDHHLGFPPIFSLNESELFIEK